MQPLLENSSAPSSWDSVQGALGQGYLFLFYFSYVNSSIWRFKIESNDSVLACLFLPLSTITISLTGSSLQSLSCHPSELICETNIETLSRWVLTFTFLSGRGNSKYHYYGIRVKPDSPLNRLQEDMQYMALRQQPVQQKQR